jgi:RNA polymerase sigma factor (sigma-70 family)
MTTAYDTGRASATRLECERLFVEHLAMIKTVAARAARVHGLWSLDAEDFTADVLCRIISDDYAVLRKFRGRSSLRTFLTVVINRMCIETLIARNGKWRPTARTVRHGQAAVLLERLVVRDGLTFDQAFTILESNPGVTADRASLEDVYATLRPRRRPRFVSNDAVIDRAIGRHTTDEGIVRREDERIVARAARPVRRALTALAAQDRMILTRHFRDGVSIADLSRALHVDQKQLYRRVGAVLKELRARLKRAGIAGPELLRALPGSDPERLGMFTPVPARRVEPHTERSLVA